MPWSLIDKEEPKSMRSKTLLVPTYMTYSPIRLLEDSLLAIREHTDIGKQSLSNYNPLR